MYSNLCKVGEDITASPRLRQPQRVVALGTIKTRVNYFVSVRSTTRDHHFTSNFALSLGTGWVTFAQTKSLCVERS